MLAQVSGKSLILDLFEEEAHVIGNLIDSHDVEDEFVWRLFRELDRLRGRTLDQLAGSAASTSDADHVPARQPGPHPAVDEFILRGQRVRS